MLVPLVAILHMSRKAVSVMVLPPIDSQKRSCNENWTSTPEKCFRIKHFEHSEEWIFIAASIKQWSATQQSVSMKDKWGKTLKRICWEYKPTIIKKSVPKWSLLISFILVIPNLLLQVKCFVDCFWQRVLFDGCWQQVFPSWSSVKEIWAGAGTGFQDSSIFTCWIMATIEALHRSRYDRTGPIPGNVKELLIVFADIWSRSSRFFLHALQTVCAPLFLTIK